MNRFQCGCCSQTVVITRHDFWADDDNSISYFKKGKQPLEALYSSIHATNDGGIVWASYLKSDDDIVGIRFERLDADGRRVWKRDYSAETAFYNYYFGRLKIVGDEVIYCGGGFTNTGLVLWIDVETGEINDTLSLTTGQANPYFRWHTADNSQVYHNYFFPSGFGSIDFDGGLRAIDRSGNENWTIEINRQITCLEIVGTRVIVGTYGSDLGSTVPNIWTHNSSTGALIGSAHWVPDDVTVLSYVSPFVLSIIPVDSTRFAYNLQWNGEYGYAHDHAHSLGISTTALMKDWNRDLARMINATGYNDHIALRQVKYGIGTDQSFVEVMDTDGTILYQDDSLSGGNGACIDSLGRLWTCGVTVL